MTGAFLLQSEQFHKLKRPFFRVFLPFIVVYEDLQVQLDHKFSHMSSVFEIKDVNGRHTIPIFPISSISDYASRFAEFRLIEERGIIRESLTICANKGVPFSIGQPKSLLSI